MALHFEFRRYRLPLRTSVRTAHEVWTERSGLIVRLADEHGRVGYGEVAPIPVFGTETADSAEAACRAIGEWPTEAQLRAVPSSVNCVRSALAAALAEIQWQRGIEAGGSGTTSTGLRGEGTAPTPNQATTVGYRSVAALLPAGKPALTQLPARLEAGFRVFKWKVGVGDSSDELSLLDDLCAALPGGAKLRLDANGAWDRRHAERWLERCAERPVEFVEQPCFAPKSAGAAAARRADDTLLGLANDFPTPIALDESLVADGDVERWIGSGWPGWFVVKPSLLGDVETAIQRLRTSNATVVFSSALETAVGARAALRIAFGWSGDPKALGFGVWPLFVDVRFDGPASAPFVREEDLARINPEVVWNALA